MTKLWAFGLPLLAGIALSLGSVAQAGTIYDNLSATPGGADPVSSLGPLADSFSTGAAATLLVDVKFLLEASSPTDGGTTSVNLLNDNSTSPGTLYKNLGSISDSSLTPSLTVVDLSGLSVALSANTRYWIELSTSNQSSANWAFSLDTTGIGVANEFFLSNGTVSPNSDGPYQMQVNTTAISSVPEPSTLTLGILGIGTLVVLRRRVFR